MRSLVQLKEHLILVPPKEPMLLFIGGWLDSSILEWFAMSLRKWTAEKRHPKCEYMAPRLIKERRCRKESTELKNYLMDAIDNNDDKMYLAPYYAGKHWSLFVIRVIEQLVVIIDLIHKDKTSYELIRIPKEVFHAITIQNLIYNP
ncbi:putative Ulp1 protease family, C-terminal catalytic domain-containing protein [Tanacetum coccineum]|uniref:Ulp1 protease family, C-terminal catalytic domain-containing protein n=1 Tax=Tanacetum coccineum TaxID=301880 RepID=A0ABQ5C0P5_9ASTR